MILSDRGNYWTESDTKLGASLEVTYLPPLDNIRVFRHIVFHLLEITPHFCTPRLRGSPFFE
jgi:hypothetical protein